MLLYFVLVILSLGLTNNAVGQLNSAVEEESYYPNLVFADTFDWKLLKEFSVQYKNVLLSPISLKLILALLYQGSSGYTEREFQNVLQFGDKNTVNDNYRQILNILQASERSEYLLNMGTSVFLDSQIPVNPKFEEKASRFYRTEIKPTNFYESARASYIINSWVESITNGKISQLVKPGDLSQTIMLIANAVYFKGTWRHQFPKNQTHLGKFYLNGGDSDSIPSTTITYMSTTDTFFMKDSVELDSKILRLPYKGSDYSMFIILPNSLGGLPNLLKKLNLNSLSSILYSMDKRLVEVNIPKFKLNFKANLGDTLKKFGLVQMFQNTASFTGITQGNNSLLRMLVVSDIVQKSGIELDEEGSVVYSATDVNIGNKFGEPTEVFNATHPFLFFIEGPNGSVLFNGKVENPLEENSLPIPQDLGDNRGRPKIQVDAQALSNPQNINSNHKNVIVPQRPVYPEFSPVQSFPNPPSVPNLSPNVDTFDKDELTYRFNLFDVELLNVFSESNTNIFVSPASIKTTLAMILEGARGNCAQEISEALRIPNINQKDVRDLLMGLLSNLNEKSASTYLESTNAIFASDKYKIYEKYRQVIEQFYKGTVKNVNFRNILNAVGIINNWVTDATHGAIREIVGSRSINGETSAVIANALYFKGKWKTEFDVQSTKTKCFHTIGGCIPTPMMRTPGTFNYNYMNRLRAHAIELPYEDKFSMLIILPYEDSNVRSVLRDLSHFKLGDILTTLKPADITLEIPKFEFDYSVDLVEYLKPLKIREIFGSKANLSGIVENGNVLVNSLVHKTKIVVDEQGTVAAAATGAIVIPLMGATTIAANRPFIFYIYHQESANIIFEGIFMNPQQSAEVSYAQVAATNRNFRIASRQFT